MRVFDQQEKISVRGRPTERIFGPFGRLGGLVSFPSPPQGTANNKDLSGGRGRYIHLAERYSKNFGETSVSHSSDSFRPGGGALPQHPTAVFK